MIPRTVASTFPTIGKSRISANHLDMAASFILRTKAESWTGVMVKYAIAKTSFVCEESLISSIPGFLATIKIKIGAIIIIFPKSVGIANGFSFAAVSAG